jgi:hypothetical protein
MFDGHIDLADAPDSGAEREKCFLTRALAAFAVAQLTGIVPAEAAKTVTDGSNDNGIDAIHYDVATKTMYVVQAKWHGDGNGSLEPMSSSSQKDSATSLIWISIGLTKRFGRKSR